MGVEGEEEGGDAYLMLSFPLADVGASCLYSRVFASSFIAQAKNHNHLINRYTGACL